MHFIGIEIEPAMVRVVAVDIESAAVVASAVAACGEVAGLPDGFAEVDPAMWLQGIDVALREVCGVLGARRSDVAALGITAVDGGMVVMDGADRVIRPAKLGGDRSAKRQVEAIARAFGGAPGVIEMIGNPPDAGWMAAQLLWLKEHEPRHYQQAARVMTVQDFVGYWLTGETGTTGSSAATTGLFAVPERAWCRELVEFIDHGAAALLPPGLAPSAPRGCLRPVLAKSWGLDPRVRVGPGLSRRAAMLLASGAARPGELLAEFTAEGALTALSEEPRVDFQGEGEVGCDAAGLGFTRMGLRNVVAAPELVRRHYGWSAAEFERAIAVSPMGADGLLFLPYLRGEDVPRLPEGCGVLHGMTLNNFTPGNLARAAAEGVAMGFGYAMSRMRDIGIEAREIRVNREAGATVTSMLADVCGVPVVAVSGAGGAAMGAAMQAAAVFFHDKGEEVGFDEIAGYLVVVDEATRSHPDAGRQEQYEAMLARQQYLVETLHGEGFI
ncbi:MAG: FGGY family carbohydrate kinase [Akkermansiaceae bacterium]|jgi:sugar (pentulose or hexulose) kinase|nr:FGGY family carbohydrate kinase [Akkermansiaceae bacterium]